MLHLSSALRSRERRGTASFFHERVHPRLCSCPCPRRERRSLRCTGALRLPRPRSSLRLPIQKHDDLAEPSNVHRARLFHFNCLSIDLDVHFAQVGLEIYVVAPRLGLTHDPPRQLALRQHVERDRIRRRNGDELEQTIVEALLAARPPIAVICARAAGPNIVPAAVARNI